uniref:T-complex protein 1 subunit eta n=1 Tax=Parastrongyloides trichosuri TaxID=131310 RepID=A0A0N4Z5T6_PARTI
MLQIGRQNGRMMPPIILLKEGTESKQGKGQIISNIQACNVIADAIRTTLGPRGMDKLIVDAKGSQIISNDGATILRKLDIVYPAASLMCDIAMSQDAEVGDGTTSVVVLCAEFLKRAKPFVEDGISPLTIIQAYNAAAMEAVSYLKSLSIKINGEKELREMLVKCAATTLSSKLVSQDRHYFAEMVVDAVQILDENLELSKIGIKKVSGGNLKDSELVRGVAFKKAFSYAGFEMQPKKYKNPKIAVLNIELELKSERDNAEVRVDNVEDYQSVIDAEWTILYDKLIKLHEAGVQVVLSKLPIGDVATQWFADRDMFCAGRLPQEDVDRTIAACGGTVMTTVSNIRESDLGTCEEFYEKQVGQERFNYFIGGPKAVSCTLILRGGAEQFIAETERSLHDAIMIVRRALKNDSIVAGGGAIDMEISKHLREKAQTFANKQQSFWLAFARSFEIIPQQLCSNAGLDSTDILNQLRYRHSKGEKWAGIDIHSECVKDNLEACIWEPALVKSNAIIAAAEAACTILSIDHTIKAPKNSNEIPGVPQAH